MSTVTHCDGLNTHGEDCSAEASLLEVERDWTTVKIRTGGRAYESAYCPECWMTYLIRRTAVIHKIGEANAAGD